MTLASLVDPSLPSGACGLTSPHSETTTIDGVSYAWGQTVVWGNTVIWGNTVDIVWSDPSLGATTVVWGKTFLDVGAAADGTIDWSKVGPTTVVWGNLSLLTQ